jgi:hypothetical protein
LSPQAWNDLFPDLSLLSVDYSNIDPTRYKDIFVSPLTFLDAWNHSEPFQRKQWRAAITKELDKMNQYQVYRLVKKPVGRNIIKHKWIFEIKRNGVFRARLVACGYSQVPGIDFKEGFSPVIHDASFRLLLIAEMVYKLKSKIIDVEVAFLNGDLEEEIYMTTPAGVQAAADECVLLTRSIYGLVQSARQFYKKLRDILLSIGFKENVADPCLFSKISKSDPPTYIAVYVDDCYAVGTDDALTQLISDLRSNGLSLKITDKPTDYLSCEIIFNRDKTMAWVGQPHLIKKMEKVFSGFVKPNTRYLTPGTPRFTVKRPNQDSYLSEKDQQIFRAGVGTLLYFVKHSRPDISNPVRELCKVMDHADEAAFNEMIRIMCFVLHTKTFALKLAPISFELFIEWCMTVYCDSDWASDVDNRRSISGFVIFVMGCPVLWRSKQQSSVALSSTEAEYMALSAAAKEIKFIYQVLTSMGIKVELPIIVKVDNVGAIFMAENATSTNRTRHISAHYHFVREYIFDGFIRIQFCRSDENKSDPFTKNPISAVYNKHLDAYLIKKEDVSS